MGDQQAQHSLPRTRGLEHVQLLDATGRAPVPALCQELLQDIARVGAQVEGAREVARDVAEPLNEPRSDLVAQVVVLVRIGRHRRTPSLRHLCGQRKHGLDKV